MLRSHYTSSRSKAILGTSPHDLQRLVCGNTFSEGCRVTGHIRILRKLGVSAAQKAND